MSLNVLSAFDGMSCGQVALERAGIEVENYMSLEIDKFAIKVTEKNYPNTIQLGDITQYPPSPHCLYGAPDLIMGGSPCQGFSLAGNQLNFDDPRSKLFFEFMRLMELYTPKYFLLENVKMKQKSQDVISDLLGVQPIQINSSLVSAQNRNRLYWTNIPFGPIEDKGILLDDILEHDVDEKYYVSRKQLGRLSFKALREGGVKGCFSNPVINTDKSECLMARDYKGIPGRQNFTMAIQNGRLRKLTPVEYERLQTLPDNYSDCVSNTQRYKMIGNGWTVDVIAHILRGINGTNTTK